MDNRHLLVGGELLGSDSTGGRYHVLSFYGDKTRPFILAIYHGIALADYYERLLVANLDRGPFHNSIDRSDRGGDNSTTPPSHPPLLFAAPWMVHVDNAFSRSGASHTYALRLDRRDTDTREWLFLLQPAI